MHISKSSIFPRSTLAVVSAGIVMLWAAGCVSISAFPTIPAGETNSARVETTEGMSANVETAAASSEAMYAGADPLGPRQPTMGAAADDPSTIVRYLSGRGKDDTVEWEFMVTGGRRAGEWTTIGVPSNWELEGFGTYNYGHDDPKADEKGRYRHRFHVPADWSGRNVKLVFGGSMTDTDVWVNGTSAGPTHQGAFYEFEYDVTDLLNYGGENELEVLVAKMSANASVNAAERQADFWVFGGIYRPVYLESRPAEHIDRVQIDARHDGDFRLDAALGRGSDGSADALAVRIYDRYGEPVGATIGHEVSPQQTEVSLRTTVEGTAAWSPEYPNLYTVEIDLLDGERLVHRTTETIGFRTIDVRPKDGIYLNGTKIRMKGVNRHSFWPDAGRTTSEAVSRMDAELIKDMNMNAVRTAHYPPDEHFLDMTDSLGLLVIDELTGWQDAYDTDVGQILVRELVRRDVNHPSVVLWANGNESGWNRALDPVFEAEDIQKRPVIHPWELFGGINTAHYQAYDCCAGTLFNGRDIFMPTEMLHGLYDGGHGAGLEDFWDAMLDNRLSAGGFLWALGDEAVLRTDLGDTLDTDGNHAPDGIVGPYREKEGSFFAIKEIWSPVAVTEPLLTPAFSGGVAVENRFHFTDLSDCTFEWSVVDFPVPSEGERGHYIAASGRADAPSIPPGSSGSLQLELPRDWYFYDALYLTARDPHGREIYTWTWMVRRPQELASRLVTPSADTVGLQMAPNAILLQSGSVEAVIDRSTGLLRALREDDRVIPFNNGPRLISGGGELVSINAGARGRARYVEALFDGDLSRVAWTMLPGGWLELSYRYTAGGHHDNLGVTFDFPEAITRSVRWLGLGPYRVWKNRMTGMTFDVWEKEYNDAITGLRWEYPEFKGHHGEMYWAVLESDAGDLSFVSATDDLFLRLFTPTHGIDPRHAAVDFPSGDISFLNAIPPIGTKFHPPENLGPQGAPNEALRWFDRRRAGEFDVVIYIRPATRSDAAE